ncbi:MAG: hypothetical protein CSA35_09735 [Dethiosulfovibrio peptidovorans]|nr:MAG: hypothetical protein CSA35_09735 [Dethiosulfovibrio peptidovorans]
MSLSDIKKKIEADANAEAENILSTARKQAEEITAAAQKDIQAMKASYEKRFESEKPEILRRREIVANLDVKKLELGAKQQLIDEVYRGALEKLNKLTAAKYRTFVEGLLDRAVQSGDEVLLVRAGEKHLNESWLKGYNEKHKSKLTMAKSPVAISGGCIVSRGKVSENASFDMLVRWLRDDLEADVVKRLFDK